MEVPDDLAVRSNALAADIPREVWKGLLKQLVAKVPVRTRSHTPDGLIYPKEMAGMAGSGPSPRSFSTQGKRTRQPIREIMWKRISVLPKGLKRANKLPPDDILHTIIASATVREATRDTRITAGDVTYAVRHGYIELLD